jgi:recombination protein RecA
MGKVSEKMSEKWRALAAAVSAIEKQFGKGSLMQMGNDAVTEKVAVIPSGSLGLDKALGVGGYPRGRVVEIFGNESSGKTTLTLHAIAQVQAQGGIAAFIDAEHALDIAYARKLGVKVEELLVSQPDSGEQALEITEHVVRSGAVDLVVVDSVAALVPRAELEGEMGDAHMGVQARLMSQALRKLTGAVSRSGTCIIFINQMRMKIGVVFGNPETTTGGNALKFYSTVRLEIRRGAALKEGDAVVGNRARVKVVKNKVAPPFQECEFDMRYGSGVHREGEVLDLAVSNGLVEKSGSFYLFNGERMGQGRDKALEFLRERPGLVAELEAKVLTTAPRPAESSAEAA